MSVIQKIRNRYGKIAGAVIAISLIGFIIQDAASGRFGDMFGRDNSVIKIDGHKIDEKEYSERLKEYEALYDIYSGGKTLDEKTRAQLNEQALSEMVLGQLIDEQGQKIGLTITPEEEKELIYGANADPMIQQFKINGQEVFANPKTGRFDPLRVKEVEKAIKEQDKTGKTIEGWEALKKYVVRNNKISKYTALLSGSVYTPKFLLDNMMKDQSEQANIDFVKVPFTSINDNEIKVTDDDLTAYIKKNAAKFEVKEPSRSIDYVTFALTPMAEDTAKSLGALQLLKPALDTLAQKDAESFVNRNSDDQYQDVFLNKKTLQSRYADSILALPVGAVYGPYYENGDFKLVKVLEKKQYPDSVKVRHILVKTKSGATDIRTDSAAKQKLDSAIAALKAGVDFKTVATKYSDDSASFEKGGEYEFTLAQKDGLSKEFGDFIYDGKTGESKTVHVDNQAYAGYHYIEILDQKAFGPAAKLAIIDKALEAGTNTDRTVYAKANEFAGKNTTPDQFDKTAAADHLDKRSADNVTPESYNIQGLGPSREVIRWMYGAKVGDISNVFAMDGKYVVAKLTGIQEKGLPSLNSTNRPMIENAVKTEKKADMIMSKYKGMATLPNIAQAAGQQVQHADSVASNASYVPAIGYAPKVVGYTFYKGFQPNTVSPAIKAGDGVYYLSLLARWQKPADPMAEQSMKQQKMMMEMQAKNGMNNMLRELLKNKASIKYNVNNM
jgi:peptidyl-prolyl cis-trans isomerase D